MTKSDKLPVWDLSALYKSVDDPKIKADTKKNLIDAQKFAKKYRSRVASLDPKQFLAAIRQLESIYLLSTKLGSFPGLLITVQSNDPQVNVLYRRMQNHGVEISNLLLFFNLEVMELTEEKINQLLHNPGLKTYHHFLGEIVKYKPHHLAESEEKIFNEMATVSGAAFDRLFDQHFASKKFTVKIGRETKELVETQVLHLIGDPDRKTRKAAAEAFTRGLAADASMLTLIYNNMVKEVEISNRWHRYGTPEEPMHMSNEVTQKIVDTMAEVVQQNYDVVEDFYNFKRQVMKVPKLYIYDRYAPISKSEKVFKFSEAKKIILNAFQKLSPKFAAAGEEFFSKNWIHAPVYAGKRGGAYCAYLTPDTHPVVFVNFQGKTRDVQTLAHELGHGINAYFMRRQNYFNFGNVLILAETASVFGEMLVFDDLKEKITDPREKFALYVDKIQDTFATVFRQTAMYKFEQDFHRLQKEKGELTTEEINKIWITRQQQMFGESLDVSGSEQWWSYIPHFLHSPFYVYSYSFGELLVLSLYAQYKKDPSGFVPKYLELMSAGSSKTPSEQLQPFGIDLSDRKFWQGGINIIKELVTEAKLIYQQFNKGK